MSIYAASLLPELEQEYQITRRVLDRVPEDKLKWKPHPKSMTLGRLANHVATIPGFFGRVLRDDSFDFANFTEEGREPGSAAELIPNLEKSLAEAKELVMSLNDENARALWSFKKDGAVLMSVPRIALVRTLMLNHWYHHRGQLSVNLRLLDIPVPAIYGPSADENPFG